MLIKGSNVIGLKVIAVREGEVIEDVDDLIFSPKDHQVKALLVKTKGLISDAKVVLLKDIKSIGRDAVIVESRDVLKKASDVSEPVSSISRDGEFLTKTKIITETGNDLGTVSDIYFDPMGGTVEELEVSGGGLEDFRSGKKRVKITDVITVGRDATIVRGYAEERVEEQAQKGGVQGAVRRGFGNLQEEVSQFLGFGEEKIREISKKVQDEAQEVRENPKVQEAVKSARQKIIQAKEDVEHEIQKARVKTEEKKPEIEEKAKNLKEKSVKVGENVKEKVQDAAEGSKNKVKKETKRQEDTKKELKREIF